MESHNWEKSIFSLQTINVREGMEKREPMYTVGGNVNWYNPLWRTEWKLLKNLRLQLLCVCVYVSACVNCFSHIQLLCDWTIGCHSLLQGVFLTQGLNLALWHCRQILYPISHQENPYDYHITTFNSTSGHISGENHNLKGYMQSSVHCSTVYNDRDMEATEMSITKGMNKEQVLHTYNGIYSAIKKNETVPFAAT